MIKLINFTSTNIFGSVKGREVYQQLNLIIDDSPQVNIFEISFEGIKIIDSSFMRESIVALTKQYSSSKAIYATNISDKDIIDNLDYAAKSKEQAIFLWNKDKYQILGPKITDSAQLLIDLIIKKNGMSTSSYSIKSFVAIDMRFSCSVFKGRPFLELLEFIELDTALASLFLVLDIIQPI